MKILKYKNWSENKFTVPVNQRQDFNRGNWQYTMTVSVGRYFSRWSPWQSRHLSQCGKFVQPGSTDVCPSCLTHVMVARWPSSSQAMRCHDKCSLKAGEGWNLPCGKSRLYGGLSNASQPKFCSKLRICRAVYGRAPSRSKITTGMRRPGFLHLMASRQLFSHARYLLSLTL